MDARLQDRLTRWHDHIQKLALVERTYLDLDAQEKPLFSALFLRAEGKSVADREAWVYVHEDWRTFKAGLVQAQVEFNKGRRELELKQSAFQAEYLNSKVEGDAIQRMPRAMT